MDSDRAEDVSLHSLSTLDFSENDDFSDGQDLLAQSRSQSPDGASAGKSSLWMAFMNMANSIIGAGIIGQAYALKQAGLLAGVALLVGLSFVIDWTLRLMVTNAKLSGTSTYQGTVKYCFGRTGMLLISISQGVFAFGGCLAFCVIIGDTIPHVLRAVFPHAVDHAASRFLTGRLAAITFCVVGISYPLSLNRNIAALAKASMLALFSMALITLTVAIRGPRVVPDDAAFSPGLLTFNTNFFQAVSIISFAFVCHHNTMLIYNSLKTPTLGRFARVVHYSVGVSMVCCLVLGLAGFLSFKDKTQSNVLNNFPGDDVMANVARFCFGFNMITTLPLEVFVCRAVLGEYVCPGEMPRMYHFAITTLLIVVSVGISLTTCDLGVILEFVGASAACTMAYILPQLCFLKLSERPRWHTQKLACYFCIAFGAVVMVISTIMTLRHVNSSNHRTCPPW